VELGRTALDASRGPCHRSCVRSLRPSERRRCPRRHRTWPAIALVRGSDHGYAARVLGATFMVVGGAGLATGGVLTVLAAKRNDHSLDYCGNDRRFCTPRGVELRREAGTLADAATLSVGCGRRPARDGLHCLRRGAERAQHRACVGDRDPSGCGKQRHTAGSRCVLTAQRGAATLLAAFLSMLSCRQVIGIDDAEVEPNLAKGGSPDGGGSSVTLRASAPSTAGAGAACHRRLRRRRWRNGPSWLDERLRAVLHCSHQQLHRNICRLHLVRYLSWPSAQICPQALLAKAT